MNYKFFISLCIFSSCVFSNDENLRSESTKALIKEFDQKNARIINSLTDSLVQVLGKQFNYACSFSRSVYDLQFTELDSDGNVHGSLNPTFVFTLDQASFLIENKIGSIRYIKDEDFFSLKTFSFKTPDEAIYIRIKKSGAFTKHPVSLDTVFTNDNRMYVVGQAW